MPTIKMQITLKSLLWKVVNYQKESGSGYDRHMTCFTKADHFKSSKKKDKNVYLMMNSALYMTVRICGKDNFTLRKTKFCVKRTP